VGRQSNVRRVPVADANVCGLEQVSLNRSLFSKFVRKTSRTSRQSQEVTALISLFIEKVL
jgi:hypothetical protein